MFCRDIVFGAFCLIAGAMALDRRAIIVRDKRDSPPPGFVKVGDAPPSQELPLRIALKPKNIAGLESELYNVREYAKPERETLSAVNKWLLENDMRAAPISHTGDMLQIKMSVAHANEVFGADFAIYKHTASGTDMVRTLQYSLPAALQGHVEWIQPTTSFTPPITKNTALFNSFNLKHRVERDTQAEPIRRDSHVPSDVPASCDTTITPECLQAMYHIPSAAGPANAGNQIAVTGFSNEFASTSDLNNFVRSFRQDIAAFVPFQNQALDGGTNPDDPAQAGLEASLDIQYVMGIATSVPAVFLSVGTNSAFGFLDVINNLINQSPTTRPSVLTTSYGFNEGDLPFGVANSLCNAYMQLGALGTSILFSSGDGGVSGTNIRTTFVPTFPSTCPYVTSVGATQNIAETAAPFSSGGFSNYFPVPDYQSAQVAAYLGALGGTNAGLFNTSGRGFPDVSFQGVGYQVVINGVTTSVFGTSASTPVFAAAIALFNDLAEVDTAGGAALGFLNPLLYSIGNTVLNDITSGSNPGCGTNGFPAITGWDPVTGLGTLDFGTMARVKLFGLSG
ncbi:family S53 protease [Mycena pura]|uniref:tripeptidyl-peptidase II n=1 Tax=Mycena pura TaxID=153505 RepID=A0AAD6UYK8_9AGAR|nr:family S53 protease [Mycena pura]